MPPASASKMWPLRGREWSAAISAFSVLAVLALTIALKTIAARGAAESFATAWEEHRQACLQLPEEKFHLDRSRAVRGFVRGPDGKPVSGASVQCIRLTSLFQLARSRPVTPALWSHLVDTETQTDSEGRYEFPHLAEGCRTICVAARGLAPDVQSLILTLDGTGARFDFDLATPKELRVRLKDADDRPRRIYLVPYRWWPEIPSREVAARQRVVEFSGIGGPFQKGLVVVSDSSGRGRWEPKAAFDLSRSGDITVSGTNYIASSRDVPEAACVLPWRDGFSEATRLFFSMLSPVALFWQTDRPSEATTSGEAARVGGQTGALHGYGANAFLPVLIESRVGRGWLQWTSEASEFELMGIPAGVYRARSMDSFGRVSFARGSVVRPSEVADLKSRLGDQVQLDGPSSREVMGIVRWQNGTAGAGAEIYLQDATDFRRFLQRVEVDQNGFFSIPNVPAAPYVAFALPPKVQHAMKSFVFPLVDKDPRETWLEFTLWPHRIVGKVPDHGSSERIDLVRQDPREGQERIVWSVSATEDGQFEIANVPQGHYVVRTTGNGSGVKGPAGSITSLPVVVENEFLVTVRWPE
jgi:hypothetical protein